MRSFGVDRVGINTQDQYRIVYGLIDSVPPRGLGDGGVGSDDVAWVEEFRIRQLHGDPSINRAEVSEARVRRARQRGLVLLTDSEWHRLYELCDRWEAGSLGSQDHEWLEWRNLVAVAKVWNSRRHFVDSIRMWLGR